MADKGLLKEMSRRMNFDLDIASKVAYIWEDNIGTQNITTSKGLIMLSRTKHIGIKYHWFRSKVRPKEIEINRIGTKE